MNIPAVLKSKPVLYGGIAVAGIVGYMMLRGNSADAGAIDDSGGGIAPSVAYGLPTTSNGGNDNTDGGFNLTELLSLETSAQNGSIELSKIQAENAHALALANSAAVAATTGKKIVAGELGTITKTFLRALNLNSGLTGIHANIGGTHINIGLTKMLPKKKAAVVVPKKGSKK